MLGVEYLKSDLRRLVWWWYVRDGDACLVQNLPGLLVKNYLIHAKIVFKIVMLLGLRFSMKEVSPLDEAKWDGESSTGFALINKIRIKIIKSSFDSHQKVYLLINWTLLDIYIIIFCNNYNNLTTFNS